MPSTVLQPSSSLRLIFPARHHLLPEIACWIGHVGRWEYSTLEGCIIGQLDTTFSIWHAWRGLATSGLRCGKLITHSANL